MKKEIKLEDVFNDEKKQGVKDLIDAQKQYFYCSDRLELDENERCVTQCEHCAVIQPKYTIGCDPYDKQETLEEACDRIFLYQSGDMTKRVAKSKALELAKWQQERMYSEEDVLKLLLNCPTNTEKETIEWFKNK